MTYSKVVVVITIHPWTLIMINHYKHLDCTRYRADFILKLKSQGLVLIELCYPTRWAPMDSVRLAVGN